jgi:hypothetical protein
MPAYGSFPWIMVRLSRTALVWALAYPVLICYWLIAPKDPGVVYADPWYPCAVVAWFPTMLATPFIWRN